MKGNQGILFSPIYLERILIYMLILMSYKKLTANKRTLVLINIYLVYFFFCFFCWDVEIIVKRGSLLFVPCIWLLFPYFLSFFKTKQFKGLFLILFLLYCSYKVYKDCLNNSILYSYSFCFMESDPIGKAKLYNKVLFGNK